MKPKNMIFRSIILLLLTGLSTQVMAQQKWTLQKCIQYAQDNGLDIKRAELNVQDAVYLEKLAEQERLPNLNGSAGGGLSFGRRIDPFSNLPVTQKLGYNSIALSTNVNIYNGGRIKNTIKQRGIDKAAAKADYEQSGQNIALDVAVAYLNILLAEDQLENSKNQFSLSQTQLEQTDKLIKAGARPAADLLDIKAQIAQDEQLIVSRENDVALAYLNLKQLLELEPDKPFGISRPEITVPEDADPEGFTLNKVYQKAVNNQPGIQAGELRVEAAKVGIDISKADRLPRLSGFAEISSNYSSLAQRGTGVLSEILIPQEVIFNSQSTTFEFKQEIEGREDTPYFNQLADNFGQVVGLNLSIPIYNRGQVKTNIQRAELALKTSQINDQAQKQQLKENIQRAIADARAGKKNYDAALQTEEALEIAYNNTDKKFKLGASNTLEFTTAKNRLEQAKVSTIIAKYDYLFKLKVVDFYMGKKIVL